MFTSVTWKATFPEQCFPKRVAGYEARQEIKIYSVI